MVLEIKARSEEEMMVLEEFMERLKHLSGTFSSKTNCKFFYNCDIIFLKYSNYTISFMSYIYSDRYLVKSTKGRKTRPRGVVAVSLPEINISSKDTFK